MIIKSYSVMWEVQVEADSEIEAARKARELQCEGTEALFFEITEDAIGVQTSVDLLKEDAK